MRVLSRFENVRIDREVTPPMLNGSPRSAAMRCEYPFIANQIQFEWNWLLSRVHTVYQ